jgi:adenylate cyclase
VTVLKADISGSTPLAERLDPEELRGILGAYFAALAREIQGHGGSVDKYIGDAVMAVFGLPQPRPDDAARAVRAALTMQQAIAVENESLHARYGVRLSLRIGLNTGDLLAPDQGEPTLMGDVVTIAESMEAAAPLDTVLVSVSTREAAARRFRFTAASPVKLKGGAEMVVAFRPLAARKRAADARATGSGTADSASLQVRGLKQHILQEERKVVTILFADVVVSEGQLAPERQRAVLGRYFADVAREVDRFGGTIDKYIGDAVMAVFGAPVSHSDDGARAIAAGLAIQAAIGRHNEDLHRAEGVRLAARVGVNTGEVVAGLLSGDVVAYTVTGDAVNTAQRIESAAPLGDVLVSESTRVLARAAFQYEAVLPLTLKGKSNPVPAYRVLRAEGGTTVEGPPLVGRQTELAWLHERFALAAVGRGQVAHLVGEAGVGKTRILAEFLSTLPSTTNVLRARANSYEGATPFALVADLIRRTFRIAPADDEPTADSALASGVLIFEPRVRDAAHPLLLEILGYGQRSALGPEQKRRLLVSLIRELIYRRSDPSLVMTVEDVHWIDSASSELFAAIVSGLPSMRCLFIATSRDERTPWPGERLTLHPLDPSTAAEMVDRVAGNPLDPATRALVVERTGGNPFFIEEVVRSIGAGETTVPATVQDMLEARLDQLDEGPRLVAQRAAIIGRTFSLSLLQRLLPRPDLDTALLDLIGERLITPGEAAPEPTFSFAHALVQEVVYRTQLIAQRRKTHVSVGDAITALYAGRLDEFVDVLAYQYGRGDDDPKARTSLLRAGHRAQRLYANAEALQYFASAIERSAADPATRADAYEALADVHRLSGRFDDALGGYEQVLAIRPAVDVLERARVKRKEGIVQQLRGSADEARRTFDSVLAEVASPEAAAERVRVLLNIADLEFRDGRAETAIGDLRDALREAERVGDDEASAEALKQLGTIHAYKGELARALEFQEKSLAACIRLGDVLGEANLYNNIGRTERRRSRHAAALDAYTKALAIRERIGDQLGRVHSHGNIAEIHYLRGELAEAERHYAASMELATSIGYAFGVSGSLVGLGATKVARGDAAAGIAQLLAAIADFEHAGQRTYIVEAVRDLTDAYIAVGSDRAVGSAERGVAIARELALPELIAIALQALGKARLAAGNLSGAIAALEESRTLLGTTGDRHEFARTLGLLGRAYAGLPDGDPRASAAPALTDEARAILRELAAALDLERLEAGWV